MMIGSTHQPERSQKSKVLIFTKNKTEEENEFLKCFGLVRNNSDNLVLGYDDQGNIYDIHHKLPESMSLDPIVNIVHQHSLRNIVGTIWDESNNHLHPPKISILFGDRSAPMTVSWVKRIPVSPEPIVHTFATTAKSMQPTVGSIPPELDALLNFRQRRKHQSRTSAPAPRLRAITRVFGPATPTTPSSMTLLAAEEPVSTTTTRKPETERKVDGKSPKMRPAARPTLPRNDNRSRLIRLHGSRKRGGISDERSRVFT